MNMLYRQYINLFKRKKIETGFSIRLPDYGIKFWLENLELAVKKISKKTFLDIGAGQGRLSVLLSQCVFENGIAIEIDCDKEKWEKILSQNKNLRLLQGLIQDNIHKIDQKIDFILLAEVFEHIPPKEVHEFIDVLSEIISQDGGIFLTTPNFVVQGPADKTSRWYEIQPYGHYKHYTVQELIDIFVKHGFKIEWYTFESGVLKRKIYNKIFYTVSRLDQKLLNSKKLSLKFRIFYKYLSYPLIWGIRSFFYIFAQILHKFEKVFNNENNSETSIVFLKKVS